MTIENVTIAQISSLVFILNWSKVVFYHITLLEALEPTKHDTTSRRCIPTVQNDIIFTLFQRHFNISWAFLLQRPLNKNNKVVHLCKRSFYFKPQNYDFSKRNFYFRKLFNRKTNVCNYQNSIVFENNNW